MAQIGNKRFPKITRRMDTWRQSSPKKQTITEKMFGKHPQKRYAERKKTTKASKSLIKKAHEAMTSTEAKAARDWVGNRLWAWGRGAIG